MNERAQFRITTLVSLVIIVFSTTVSIVGFFAYANLGRLGIALPVKTVDQFRNIANLMPLVSELSSNMEPSLVERGGLNRRQIAFAVSKIRIGRELVHADFGGSPPADLATILEELRLIDAALSADLESASPLTDRNCHFGFFAVSGQTDRNCHFGFFAVSGQLIGTVISGFLRFRVN